MSEIITLQPGVTAGTRRDWSPTAQPAAHDMLAHTPDPKAYHYSGDGRVMIPRSDRYGGSLGFKPTDGVIVNIDPSDPVKGTGGLTIDLRKVNPTNSKQAAADGSDDVYSAWQRLATFSTPVQNSAPARQQPSQAISPPPMSGYVVPRSDPSGTVTPVQFTVPSPSASRFDGQQFVPVRSSALPPPPSASPQEPMNTTDPAYHPMTTGVPTMPAMSPSWQEPTPTWVQPVPTPNTLPVQPAPQPAQPSMLEQTLYLMMQQMQARDARIAQLLENAARPAPTPPEPPPTTGIDYKEEVRRMKEEEAYQREETKDNGPQPGYETSDIIQSFVGQPRRPEVPVVFDLGSGGLHRVHFHHVSQRGSSIFLYYDDRYKEGYRFLPPVTPPKTTVSVTLPKKNDATFNVTVLPLNNTLDYVDIVQLLIVKPEAAQPTTGELATIDPTRDVDAYYEAGGAEYSA